MKLILHTFRKDVRRLWPAVAVSVVLLAMLAWADRWRTDSTVGSTEGWLNILLPLAWACVLALAVLEEPLIGDRHFWLTRPHRWPALLSAKLLFALLFVHLPSVVADCYVVMAHGFSLFECLPQLLGKQAMLAAAVTLPAMALAALAAGFTQFFMLLFAVAAGAIFVFGPFPKLSAFQRPEDYLRSYLVASMVALAAIAILGLQYRRRKPAVARTVASVTALVAGVWLSFVPEIVDYRLRALLHPAAQLALHMEQRKLDVPGQMVLPFRRTTVALPVALSGLPAGAHYYAGPVDLTVTMPDGSRLRNTILTPDDDAEKVLLDAEVYRYPYKSDTAPLNLLLGFDKVLYEKFKDRPVRVAGRMAVVFYRTSATAWMPMNGRVAALPVGHCSNAIGEDRWSRIMVKVLCESPSPLPRDTRATIVVTRIGREWQERLGSRFDFTIGPHWAWLSPLDRSRAAFPVSDPRTRREVYSMEVPMEYLDQAKVGVAGDVATGYTLVDFDFRDVTPASYRVPGPAWRN
jgi:hypothetical protein